MNTLRLYAAVSCFFLFLSCVENEIETLRVFDLMGKEVLHKTPQQQKLTLNTFTPWVSDYRAQSLWALVCW